MAKEAPYYTPIDNFDPPNPPKIENGMDMAAPDSERSIRVLIAEGRFYDFTAVEERLIEAWQFLRRVPDPSRHGHWLGYKSSSIFREIVREWNDYWQTDDKPLRFGLRVAEIERMEEALSWIEWVRPADRKLIGMVLAGRSSAQARPEWEMIKRALAWRGTREALASRYDRAIASIAIKLNQSQPIRAERGDPQG